MLNEARSYLSRSGERVGCSDPACPSCEGHWAVEALPMEARNFAETLLQVAGSCVVGLPCERHAGVVHGQEAEELRVGIEQILENTTDVDGDDAEEVLAGVRKSLSFLLDRIDARDSLAFREAVSVGVHVARPRGNEAVDGG